MHLWQTLLWPCTECAVVASGWRYQHLANTIWTNLQAKTLTISATVINCAVPCKWSISNCKWLAVFCGAFSLRFTQKCVPPRLRSICQQLEDKLWRAGESHTVSASVRELTVTMHGVCSCCKWLKISGAFSLSSIRKGLWKWLPSIDQHLTNKFCKILQATTLTISATLTNGAVAMHEVSSDFKWSAVFDAFSPLCFKNAYDRGM